MGHLGHWVVLQIPHQLESHRGEGWTSEVCPERVVGLGCFVVAVVAVVFLGWLVWLRGGFLCPVRRQGLLHFLCPCLVQCQRLAQAGPDGPVERFFGFPAYDNRPLGALECSPPLLVGGVCTSRLLLPTLVAGEHRRRRTRARSRHIEETACVQLFSRFLCFIFLFFFIFARFFKVYKKRWTSEGLKKCRKFATFTHVECQAKSCPG